MDDQCWSTWKVRDIWSSRLSGVSSQTGNADQYLSSHLQLYQYLKYLNLLALTHLTDPHTNKEHSGHRDPEIQLYSADRHRRSAGCAVPIQSSNCPHCLWFRFICCKMRKWGLKSCGLIVVEVYLAIYLASCCPPETHQLLLRHCSGHSYHPVTCFVFSGVLETQLTTRRISLVMRHRTSL